MPSIGPHLGVLLELTEVHNRSATDHPRSNVSPQRTGCACVKTLASAPSQQPVCSRPIETSIVNNRLSSGPSTGLWLPARTFISSRAVLRTTRCAPKRHARWAPIWEIRQLRSMNCRDEEKTVRLLGRLTIRVLLFRLGRPAKLSVGALRRPCISLLRISKS